MAFYPARWLVDAASPHADRARRRDDDVNRDVVFRQAADRIRHLHHLAHTRECHVSKRRSYGRYEEGEGRD